MFTLPLALMVSSPSRRDAMKEAIGYVRVSSEEQADSGLGLQAQRQRILAFCAMKGLRLGEVFEDAGVSGGKPLSSRPSGSRLLNAARRGKVVVVVAKLEATRPESPG
jgi:site-specific DNA recombinase